MKEGYLKHLVGYWKSSVNPFPNTQFWDHPKFKEAADDNWNAAINGF